MAAQSSSDTSAALWRCR